LGNIFLWDFFVLSPRKRKRLLSTRKRAAISKKKNKADYGNNFRALNLQTQHGIKVGCTFFGAFKTDQKTNTYGEDSPLGYLTVQIASIGPLYYVITLVSLLKFLSAKRSGTPDHMLAMSREVFFNTACIAAIKGAKTLFHTDGFCDIAKGYCILRDG
jgi:hypothetical protein